MICTDMIIQAKSGTGKTCVFAVVSLEMVNVQVNEVQVVILAPTREIVLQICDNINCIGVEYPGLKCFAFIGGIALEQDKVCILPNLNDPYILKFFILW